ncbi:HAD family hydrolase [Heyndrickxia acidicola]|uniref:HAD family hydrolase n=1 Tax=Heyndrickxia acidicola TaxID=209389 RepID=A0ABU6MEW0_9BACI|nr:HAD family hydrolase [Heyndrickxia acidicola]MED1202968.1 HAD family hydrolase [Heyndrickxia acidicola]
MKAIIFDFDGTIIDTESVWYEQSKKLLLEQYEFELELEVFARFIGTHEDGINVYYKKSVGESFDIKQFNQQLNERVNEHVQAISAREGFSTLFEKAKEIGLKIGLATSSGQQWIEPFLARFGILNQFDAICTRDEVSRVKPDPELYELALKKLRVDPSEAVAIEDSVNGSLSALGAGLSCIVIPNPVTSHSSFHADTIKHQDFKSVLEEIITLTNK